jgi:exopolyphosphatase/guanosine-5'-triphosphate,3'-diphosphate pyrophosphatase
VAGQPAAAIDLGSTSVHILVGCVVDGGLISILDESAFLGLGAAVDGPGFLGAEARATLTTTVAAFVERARALGAADPIVIGTEPLRRLRDAGQIVAEVAAACGTPLHVLEHEEEGLLTLIGLLAGRAVDRDTLVVDIGGGSTELVEIGPGQPARAAGVKIGAGKLTRSVVSHDPATSEEIAGLYATADAAFDWTASRRPGEVFGVGGTASNLLKLLRRREGATDVDLDFLDRRLLDAVRAVLAGEPAATLAARYQMREARIRLLAAGAAILEVVLDRTGADRIRVADTGIREGAIIAADHAGPRWRDRLQELAHGWLR